MTTRTETTLTGTRAPRKRVLVRRDEEQPTKVDRILQAAEHEFASLGRAAASMRAIAARAGCAQSLIHHYFPSKEALWLAVGRKIAQDFFALQAPFIEDPAPDRDSIRQGLVLYWRFWRDHPTAARLYLWRQMEGSSPESIAREVANNARAKSAFERAQASGALRRDLPADMLMCIFAGAILNGVFHAHQIQFPDEASLIDALMTIAAP